MRKSLEEINGTVAYHRDAPSWKKVFFFLGPGALVAVGYMDPETG